MPFIDPGKYIFTQNKDIMNFDIRIDDRLLGLGNAKIKLLFNSLSNNTISEEELKEKNVIRVNGWDDIEKILLEE